MMVASLYTRPNKAATIPTRKRRNEAPTLALPSLNDVVEVDCFTECHVTPKATCSLMIDYLGVIEQGKSFFEPQGGTGNIVQAAIDRGVIAKNITTVERHYKLCDVLSTRFDHKVNVIHRCFLEYAEDNKNIRFDYIVTNPPFKNITKHINAALKMLNAGGTMIALVPVTFKHNEMNELEQLGDIFANANVRTKLVEFNK